MNMKRVLAISGIVLLVAMYVITLIMALLDKSSTTSWFYASLFCTMVVPVLLWVYIRAYELTRRKKDDDSQQ